MHWWVELVGEVVVAVVVVVVVVYSSSSSSSSSGSRSSQNRLLNPFHIKPESGLKLFIQHSSEKGGRQERMEKKHRYHYQHHHNYLPTTPTLTEQ